MLPSSSAPRSSITKSTSKYRLCNNLLCSLLTPHNRNRERIWNAMTVEEKEEYITTTKDRGNKRLDFRFAH